MATNKKTMKAINKNSLPDTQGLEDTRNLPINKVGILDLFSEDKKANFSDKVL